MVGTAGDGEGHASIRARRGRSGLTGGDCGSLSITCDTVESRTPVVAVGTFGVLGVAGLVGVEDARLNCFDSVRGGMGGGAGDTSIAGSLDVLPDTVTAFVAVLISFSDARIEGNGVDATDGISVVTVEDVTGADAGAR